MQNVFSEIALNNIDVSLQTIEGITDNEQFEELQIIIPTSIHNAVHSLVDFYERLDKSSLQPEEDELFRAFMYVNNQLKHDKDLQFVTYNIAEKRYPYFYPCRYGPPGVCWADFVDNGSQNARGKRRHYEQMLMDKDIQETLESVRGIILRLKGEQQ